MKAIKYSLIVFLMSVFFGACTPQERYSYYGDAITTENAISPDEFLTQMDSEDSMNVKMEAKIIETCQKKGCWMTLDLGNGEEMRVTFKDYGFFVPTEGVEGKTVVIEGIARKTTTDIETLKHYAEDAGKSEEQIAAISEPKQELIYVATGAAIKDHQE